MGDRALYRPKHIPTEPGVYRFKNSQAQVLYVGKAKNLKSRLNSYFGDIAALPVRTQAMLRAADSVDWVIVGSEVEALQLEFMWIKEFNPRFNVRFRDDKSYPYLAISLNEQFPRAMVARGAQKKNLKYFGPYVSAFTIRDTLDHLVRVFPVRTCRNAVFQRHKKLKRPCLLGDIERCSAPCVERIEESAYQDLVKGLSEFLSGKTRGIMKQLSLQMRNESNKENFERAAVLRDRIKALEYVLEKSSVVYSSDTRADLIAIALDEMHISTQIFHIKQGRILGERAFVTDRTEVLTQSEHLRQLVTQLYGEAEPTAIPNQVLTNFKIEEKGLLTAWLSKKAGHKVTLTNPSKGDKSNLLASVTKNAVSALARHKLKRASDLDARSKAINELSDYLDLDTPALRIEGIDISTLQGKDTIAALVAFEDGLPKKNSYRKFTISKENAHSDLASIRETVERRYRYLVQEQNKSAKERERFSYRPSLLLIDGGQQQCKIARAALAELGLVDITVIGLAKRLEEVWLADNSDPLILPRNSEALFLLQRVRDEAHRFANSALATRRRKAVLEESKGEKRGQSFDPATGEILDT
ncbi:MAG: excinuclease ABC subunit UvrC [Candidatus Nanopelagicales bacterium]